VRRTALALLLLGAAAGCGGTRPGTKVSVSPSTSLADEPVHISVSGLKPSARVTVTLASTDAAHVRWASSAEFRASTTGHVALDRAAPVTGAYAGVWGGGLLRVWPKVLAFLKAATA
jgi:hypothetical protein